MVQLVQEYVRSCFLCTKYFYSVLVYKVYPHLSNGTHFSGFSYHKFVNPQVFKYTVHQGAVKLAK